MNTFKLPNTISDNIFCDNLLFIDFIISNNNLSYISLITNQTIINCCSTIRLNI